MENSARSWGLTGHFLDPNLFQMLAHSARLQLPEQPLHIPTWRQAGCLTFHLQLSHVLRVGHLQPLTSPARLPMCWSVANLPLPCPIIFPVPLSLQRRGGLSRGSLLLELILQSFSNPVRAAVSP